MTACSLLTRNVTTFLVFDDDLSQLAIHSDGWPPVPTVAMIWNRDNLPAKFEWTCNSTRGTADISSMETDLLVESFHYVTPPDLFDLTGYKNTSRTSYLVRKSAVAD